MHFAFAIFFAVLYCVVAEYWPKIKLWQGVAFGIVLDILFHVIIMPAMGVVPAPWNQPFGSTSLSSLGTSSGCGRLSWSAATCVTALPVNPMQSTR